MLSALPPKKGLPGVACIGLAFLAAPASVALAATSRAEIEASFRPAREKYIVGAPIDIHLTLKNQSRSEVKLTISDTSFRFRAHDAKGKSVAKKGAAPVYGTRISTRTTGPGKTFTRTVLLDRYLKIAVPGSYVLVCELDVSLAEAGQPQQTRRISCRQELEIDVGAPDQAELGARAKELMRKLADPDDSVRLHAVGTLGFFDVETSLPCLETAVAHGAGVSRQAAIYGLARLGDRRAVQAVSLAAQADDPGTRSAAVSALGTLLKGSEDADAVRLLATKLSDEDRDVRDRAISALRRIGGDEATALLQPLMDDPDPTISRRSRYELAGMHIEALERRHGPGELVPALIEEFSSSDSYVCQTAARALTETGAEAIPVLVEALGNEERAFRVWATRSLAMIGSPAVPALIEQLRHEDRRVRGNALVTLGTIGPDAQPATPAISQLLQDADEKVRAAAAKALAGIRAKPPEEGAPPR